MEVINKIIDISKAYRCTVVLPDGNGMPLKFDSEISDEEVLAYVQSVLDRQEQAKVEEQARIDYENSAEYKVLQLQLELDALKSELNING